MMQGQSHLDFVNLHAMEEELNRCKTRATDIMFSVKIRFMMQKIFLKLFPLSLQLKNYTLLFAKGSNLYYLSTITS